MSYNEKQLNLYSFEKLISILGSKNYDIEKMINFFQFEFINDEVLNKIEMAAYSSIGVTLSDVDFTHIKTIIKLLLQKYIIVANLRNYVIARVTKIGPNLSALVGPLFAAKLISKANGLFNLIKLPSSTVQLLGAEKALFRSLKGKSNTPKYGIIYEKLSDFKEKGRMARFLATKISIASRIDYFGRYNTDIFGKALRKMVEQKLLNKKTKLTCEVLKEAYDTIHSI
ncbi:hypothetical protein EDEG_00362 [Edhazardia aedis USNM 41457]|uniref:Nop domain-containing protein n=1 Tax=Edhazardia aedis (strain USNM 41457) TaxID=1003232 RepID=J9D1Q1_EDHAE|nr:hypothetical protein EDEG_00362 [Edhazardia aedis USNM 41457]|eukprot:EJW01771.1 hypothetical protein EDEG_00362 [Edhazardia aedis USNM 41457]